MTPFLSLYTPSTQPPELLEELLVGREEIVARIVDDLVRSVETDTKQHHLVVGPRGIGKTHLVSVVYHRLKARAVDGMNIAWLREDPWGMRSIDKLLEEISRALATEGGTDPLLRGAGETAGWFLNRLAGDGTIVLIVENMNSVFKRIKPEGQRQLRAHIHNDGRLVIFGTAPSLFDGVTSQNDPFYGTFCVTKLDELDIDQAQDLMQRVARLRNDSALEQLVSTATGRRRLEAIRHLAGGHPRLWMLFADCVTVESLDELVPLFLKAMDDLTPYYQDRMRELEGQQEEVVAHLCDVRGARTVGQIAQACAIDQRTAGVQLTKLAEKGYVRKIELSGPAHKGDARSAHYELREPLMRLCLDVKESRGKPIRLIVEFLRGWFDITDLRTMASKLSADGVATGYLTAALRGATNGSSPDEFLALESEPDRSRAMAAALDLGRIAEAIDLGEALMEDLSARPAGIPSDALATRNNLAYAYQSAGNLARSIPLYEQALIDMERVLGPDHPNTLTSRSNLARACRSAGDLPRAMLLLEQTLDGMERVLGPDHPTTLGARRNLATVYRAAGRAADSIEQLGELLRSSGPSGAHLIGALMGVTSPSPEDPVVMWAQAHAPGALGWAALNDVAQHTQSDGRVSPERLETWARVVRGLDEAVVPFRIANAIASWSNDRDRRHLLELSSEERSIAISLLGLATS